MQHRYFRSVVQRYYYFSKTQRKPCLFLNRHGSDR
nr:MAG TPA: hypothetical protein [Caudoviricetes sp.]